jgi:hypothetical protein
MQLIERIYKGFVIGHQRTNTTNTSSRFCGNAITPAMIKQNDLQSNFQTTYFRESANPTATKLQVGSKTLL